MEPRALVAEWEPDIPRISVWGAAKVKHYNRRALAAMLGAAQALVFPATIALVAARIAPDRVGAGMGLVGALKNTGKVVGPVVGGLLVQLLEFQWMVRVMALLLLVVAGLVWLGVRTASPRESARAESARPA